MSRRTQKKKNRTRKFILLLFLTIIMLGASTYAWFTANRVVTISTIDVQVEATNGIQISTDGENWKSLITNADITAGYTNGSLQDTNALPGTVTAVSTNGKFSTSTGKLTMYSGTVESDDATGRYVIETVAETDGTSDKYVVFDVFLRVDSTRPVYLTSNSSVSVATGSTDKGLKNAARVAFIPQGHVALDATLANILGANDIYSTAGTNNNAIIWEPNVDGHETLATDLAREYGISIPTANATTPTSVQYYGVNSATQANTPVDLQELVTQQAYTTGSTFAAQGMADLVTPTIKSNVAGLPAGTQLLSLTAGITKVRIYMWIEGQDIDCENGATGSAISFDVSISTDETE